jgi:hypothetical protein
MLAITMASLLEHFFRSLGVANSGGYFFCCESLVPLEGAFVCVCFLICVSLVSPLALKVPLGPCLVSHISEMIDMFRGGLNPL